MANKIARERQSRIHFQVLSTCVAVSTKKNKKRTGPARGPTSDALFLVWENHVTPPFSICSVDRHMQQCIQQTGQNAKTRVHDQVRKTVTVPKRDDHLTVLIDFHTFNGFSVSLASSSMFLRFTRGTNYTMHYPSLLWGTFSSSMYAFPFGMF